MRTLHTALHSCVQCPVCKVYRLRSAMHRVQSVQCTGPSVQCAEVAVYCVCSAP